MRVLSILPVVAAMPFVLSAPLPTQASETTFYNGNSWSIRLYADNATATNPPYCGMETTHWADKAIAINFKLVSLDEVVPEIALEKTGWKLPVGETTKVRFGIYNGGVLEYSAVAASQTELHLNPTANGVSFSPFVKKTVEMIYDYRGSLQIAVGFKGSEANWVAGVLNSSEKYLFKAGLEDCKSTLRKLGPSIFPEALNNSPTSPFVASDKKDTASHQPSEWEFSKREEDWGDTCYAEKKQGDITIGFMKARGHDLEGFVENGLSGSVKTLWKVDSNTPITLEGVVNDYFGWHSFSGLNNDFINSMESGKKLTITEDKGTVINADLNGALQALWQFSSCSGTMDQ
ncbi:hypothetical protein [Agrobacterium rosae]|uniref:hypothetical protein n=1 Tax=Agrobacterium rosae TaxID=1972867 RepID=UPI000CD96E84|nr:hypothetical protein [Agrobacterium rosae]POO56707.1 hypothetical protein CTT39_08490 [Agrobacterium rosae]